MSQIEIARAPAPTDKQLVMELFYQTPLLERFAPLFKEIMWILSGSPNFEQHQKLLPEYCCNILDTFKKTYFKNFPLLADTLLVMNPAAVPTAKTLEEAKKVIRFDWKNLGVMCAIGIRCIRFAELEAEGLAGNDGFGNEPPESAKELFAVIYGRPWVAENEARILATPADKLFAELLNEFIGSWVADFRKVQPQLNALAYQWSPEAMIQFSEGYAEGMTAFLDGCGQLTGETDRSNTYTVLLLAWPEITVMQAAQPRKTLTHLLEWLQPFMRLGIMPNLDIEQFRDVCAPPSQNGIGLSLRPLKSRRASA